MMLTGTLEDILEIPLGINTDDVLSTMNAGDENKRVDARQLVFSLPPVFNSRKQRQTVTRKST